VGDADGAVGLVDVLAAGAAGAEGVDTQLGWVEGDLLGLVGLGHHGHGAGGGVDAALAFGGRHALYAVAAALEAQLAVDAIGGIAFNADDDLLVAAELGVALRQDLGAPALALAVAQVHAGQVAGEERALVAAGAGADLEEGVAIVVGVLRQQRGLQLGFEALHLGAGGRDLIGGHGRHLGVVGGLHLARLGDVGLALAVALPALDDALHLALLAQQRAVALEIGRDLAVGQRGVELGQAQRQAVEAVAKGGVHGGRRGRAHGQRRRHGHAARHAGRRHAGANGGCGRRLGGRSAGTGATPCRPGASGRRPRPHAARPSCRAASCA
jgi:hypothetical protein